jgi:hypothetical protein
VTGRGAGQRARAFAVLAAALTSAAAPGQALAGDPAAPDGPTEASGAIDPRGILDQAGEALRVDAVTTRISSFNQFGHGYQAQGGPTPISAGSERVTVLEPQLEIDASQGTRIKHRFWIPVDVVTNASPDAIDVVSSASRHVEAGTIDWAATAKVDDATDVTMLTGVHLENPFRSWHAGLSTSRSLADGDTVVSASLLAVYDWFDRFDIHGARHGRTNRANATASAAITQTLTPTTIVSANYGITVQRGQLGNTWNSVPLSTDTRGPEILPVERVRHAAVVHAAQFLPWNGALHASYRFYADDWGIVAHSAEVELLQRLLPTLYVGARSRYHTQHGVFFFTTLADADSSAFRTADSDLAPLSSITVGGKVVFDAPMRGDVRALHVEFGYDEYLRSNDLHIDVFTCAVGFRF